MEKVLGKIWLDFKNRIGFFFVSLGAIILFMQLIKKSLVFENNILFSIGDEFFIAGIISIFLANALFYGVKTKNIIGIFLNILFVILFSRIKNKDGLMYVNFVLEDGYIIYMLLAMQEKVGNGFFLKEVWDYIKKTQIVYPIFLCVYFSHEIINNFIFNFQIYLFCGIYNKIDMIVYFKLVIVALLSIVMYGVLKYTDEDKLYKKIGYSAIKSYLKIMVLFAVVGYIGLKIYKEDFKLNMLVVIITVLYFIAKEIKIREIFHLVELEINPIGIIKNMIIVAILGYLSYFMLNFMKEFMWNVPNRSFYIKVIEIFRKTNNELLRSLYCYIFNKVSVIREAPEETVLYYKQVIRYILTYILIFRVDMMFIKNNLIGRSKGFISKKIRIFLLIILLPNFVEIISKINYIFTHSVISFEILISLGAYLVIEMYIVNYLAEKAKN